MTIGVLAPRNIASKDDWPTRKGIKTLYDQFEDSVKRAADRNCLGWRPLEGGKAGPFQWFSYKETQSAPSALSALSASSLQDTCAVAIPLPGATVPQGQQQC